MSGRTVTSSGYLVRAMNGKGTLIFFLLGFLIAIYSGISILTVSVFAAIIAYIFTELFLKDAEDRGRVQ